MGPWNHRGPYKGKKEVRVRERFEDAVLLALKLEAGATSPGMQEASKAGKVKEMDFPLEPELALPTP